jgi:hypothetical protein
MSSSALAPALGLALGSPDTIPRIYLGLPSASTRASQPRTIDSRPSQQDGADDSAKIEKEIDKINKFMDNDIQIPEVIKKNNNYILLINNIAKLKLLLQN